MVILFATLALVFLIFDIFLLAEVHTKDKLLKECAEFIAKTDLEKQQLLMKNTSVINAVTSLRWVLFEIRDCGDSDSIFCTWARRMAADALERSKKAYGTYDH